MSAFPWVFGKAFSRGFFVHTRKSGSSTIDRPPSWAASEPLPGPLVRQPVSGLPAAVWTVAARVFRLWLLDRPDVGPRHACVAPFVCRVILAISHQIFGPVRIVLQKWHGANAIGTGREGHNHRSALLVADQPRPHLIPSPNGPMPGNAPIVRAAEVDLVSRPFAIALGQRRAAVLGEGGRVEHAV